MTSDPAKTHDEERQALDYFDRTRLKVVHEDDLVNQRLTWLLLLQGFLFSAYGFSMSAEAVALSGKVYEASPTSSAIAAHAAFIRNLAQLRQGLVVVGIFSALVALAGVLAAFRAIRDDEAGLARFPDIGVSGTPLFPMVIGARSSNVLGMCSGLGMPFLAFGAWIIVGNLSGQGLLASTVGLILAACATLVYVFVKIVPR